MSKPIYTLDIETDPFHEGRYPAPFAIGLWADGHFYHKWGVDCIEQIKPLIDSLPPGIIYAHNGGRFDIFYLLEWVVGNPMRIVNSRIIKAKMRCDSGWHELRDSYAIMPFPLGSYKGSKRKLDIAIWKLEGYVCSDIRCGPGAEETTVREIYREEITDYLKHDCEVLHILCSAFTDKFGPQLTIGSTAMKELRKLHEFECIDPDEDKQIRDLYYYGGRVECFEKGVCEGAWKVYDLNSAYPAAMKNYMHPIGRKSHEGTEITDETCFVSVEGENFGAFPYREKNGSLRFDKRQGIFHVSIHEYNVATHLGLFRPSKIVRTIDYDRQGNFQEFVDYYYGARQHAKEIDDLINEIFFKLILNSAYGKFSQNPDKYEESIICLGGRECGPQPQCICDTDVCDCGGWDISSISTLKEKQDENYWVWTRPTTDVSRFNVGTGASITGAARSMLLGAIANGKRVAYCDTDSVICEEFSAGNFDGKQLGAWKLEAQGTTLAIGGKKLYALLDSDKNRIMEHARVSTEKGKKLEYVGNSVCVKKANKGVVVSASQIFSIANGETITSIRNAPSFKVDGSYRFIKRRVQIT